MKHCQRVCYINRWPLATYKKEIIIIIIMRNYYNYYQRNLSASKTLSESMLY